MGGRLLLFGAFLAALPVEIDPPRSTRDSSGAYSTETNLSIVAGAGSYAVILRGCEGNVLSSETARYRDIGASVDHKFSNPIRVGLRAGTLHSEFEGGSIDNSYVNPSLSLDWRYLSLGGGYLVSQHGFPGQGDLPTDGDLLPFSAHLRLGTRRVHFLINIMENVPLYSGGGYGDLGFGFRPGGRMGFFVGLNPGGPYDGVGAALRANYALNRTTAPAVDLGPGHSQGQGLVRTEVRLGGEDAGGVRPYQSKCEKERRPRISSRVARTSVVFTKRCTRPGRL